MLDEQNSKPGCRLCQRQLIRRAWGWPACLSRPTRPASSCRCCCCTASVCSSTSCTPSWPGKVTRTCGRCTGSCSRPSARAARPRPSSPAGLASPSRRRARRSTTWSGWATWSARPTPPTPGARPCGSPAGPSTRWPGRRGSSTTCGPAGPGSSGRSGCGLWKPTCARSRPQRGSGSTSPAGSVISNTGRNATPSGAPARNGRRCRPVVSPMTTTQQVKGHGEVGGGASPVDFAAFGDYGDFRKKQPQPASGEFVRPAYPFRGRITADGSSGYPAVVGRYHLYISWACPWAHPTAIVRRLLGLEDVISLSAVDPIRDGRGWAFREGPGYSLDPVNGFSFLREAYEASEPGYDGHISVPVLWDRETGKIVSNNFPDITIDLDTQFGALSNQAYDLYPASLRPEIDAINAVVYETVNNGVYRSGMATSQEAYHEAVSRIFATLDDLEQRLADRRYLLGDAITEADVRLWVTLARFDAVYHYHFK